MLPRLSLRRKLLLAFAIVLLPVLALLVVDFQTTADQNREFALREQLLTAQAVAVQVDEAYDAAIGVGWAIANDPFSQTMDPALLDPHLKRLVQRHPVYDGIYVFDAKGENKGWGNPAEPADPRLNIADRQYFQQVIATNVPVVSEVLQLLRPEVTGVAASVPVRGADDRPIGAVVVITRTDQMAARYAGAALRGGQAIFLVDRTGRLAFHTERRDLPWAERNAFSGQPHVQQALTGVQALVPDYVSPVVGDRRLGAFTPTPNHGWVVGVSVPRGAALAISDESFVRRLAGFVAILLFSGALAGSLARYFTAPVRRLEQSARALGSGDLGRRVDIRTGDEIEALGHSFNEMASQLQGRQAEILSLRAEAERRAGQLAAIIDSMNDAVLIASSDRRLLEVNPAGKRLLGREDGFPLGRPFHEYRTEFQFRHLDGQPLLPQDTPLSRALGGESVSGFEMLLRRADGQDRVVSASGGPVRDQTGAIVLAVVVVRDVTEARRSQEEKVATAEIARALVRELELRRVAEVVMEQGVRALGADAVEVHLAEPTRQELALLAHNHASLSAETEQAIGRITYGAKQVAAWVARSGQLRVVDDLSAVVEEFPVSNQAGRREGYRSVLALPLQNRGRLVGVVTLFAREPRAFAGRDLGMHTTVADLFAVAIENAHLYTEVREALRLRDEFIASAAHELKTPVTVIKGWAQLLLMSHAREPEVRRALETVDRQADRVARFIDDLLSAADLRPGRLEQTPERIDLSLYVRSLVEQMGGMLEGCRLRAQADTPLPVMADRRMLGDVLRQLIENAVRYSPPDGEVVIEARAAGAMAVVYVRDQGVGIPPERQPYVFEPFFQPVPPGVPGYVGVVSLGLHLSKQMVEVMGGQIWFVSEPGKGSTFAFGLPLHEATS